MPGALCGFSSPEAEQKRPAEELGLIPWAPWDGWVKSAIECQILDSDVDPPPDGIDASSIRHDAAARKAFLAL